MLQVHQNRLSKVPCTIVHMHINDIETLKTLNVLIRKIWLVVIKGHPAWLTLEMLQGCLLRCCSVACWYVAGLLVDMLQSCLLRCYRVAWGKWGLPLPGPVCLPCPHCGKWTIRNQAENYMWCKIKSGKWFRDLLDRFLNICWKIIQ